MSLDSKYIFVDIEFLKSISECIESLKRFDEYDNGDKALVMAASDIAIEQIDELIDGYIKG